jgi:hypothetical protein
LSGSFAADVAGCDASQLVVDERPQLGYRVLVAARDLLEAARGAVG